MRSRRVGKAYSASGAATSSAGGSRASCARADSAAATARAIEQALPARLRAGDPSPHESPGPGFRGQREHRAQSRRFGPGPRACCCRPATHRAPASRPVWITDRPASIIGTPIRVQSAPWLTSSGWRHTRSPATPGCGRCSATSSPTPAGRCVSRGAFWRYAADESKPNWYLPYSGGRAPGELSALETAALRTRVHRDIAAAARNELVLVKTHSYFGSLEAHRLQELELTAGALYIVRNPLDVVPSMADHFGVSLDEAIDFLANEMTGTPGDEQANVASVLCSWSTHVLSWCQSRLARLQVIRYEDLLDNGPATLAKVTRFLAMGHDPARIKRAIRSSSVEELRRRRRRRFCGAQSEFAALLQPWPEEPPARSAEPRADRAHRRMPPAADDPVRVPAAGKLTPQRRCRCPYRRWPAAYRSRRTRQ